MNRRTFIQTAALLAAGAASADAPLRPAKIIDAHTHFFDPSRAQGVPWPPKDDAVLYRTTLPEDYRRIAQPLAVAGTIVVEASEWVEDNQWVLDLAARDPFIVGVVGNLRSDAPEFAAQLKRFAANPIFRGIRFREGSLERLLGDSAFVAGMKLLADRGLTFDVQSSPAWAAQADRLAQLVPDLRLVINHVAGAATKGEPPTDAWRRMIEKLASHKNIWMKVSGLVEGSGHTKGDAPTQPEIYRPVLDELWRAFGPERLIYASNWPVCSRFAPLARVQKIALDYFTGKGQAVLDNVFWKNAQAAYGLPASRG